MEGIVVGTDIHSSRLQKDHGEHERDTDGHLQGDPGSLRHAFPRHSAISRRPQFHHPVPSQKSSDDHCEKPEACDPTSEKQGSQAEQAYHKSTSKKEVRQPCDHMVLPPSVLTVHPSADPCAEHQKHQHIRAGQDHRRECLMDPEKSGCDEKYRTCPDPVRFNFPDREQI